MWRQGFVRTPEPDACEAAGAEADACRCACAVDPDDSSFDAYEFLEATHMLHWLGPVLDPQFYYDDATDRYRVLGKSDDEADVVWRRVVKALCDPQDVGDMFTSAAPADPLFWPIHTTAERLLHYRRLLDLNGIMNFTQDFRYEHAMSQDSLITPPSDTGYVCDWSSGDSSMPSCEKGVCAGHGANDLLPFGNFTGRGDTYTNLEFYHYSAPDNEALPYLYDNFAWEHCLALGYDFRPTGYNASAYARYFTWGDGVVPVRGAETAKRRR